MIVSCPSALPLTHTLQAKKTYTDSRGKNIKMKQVGTHSNGGMQTLHWVDSLMWIHLLRSMFNGHRTLLVVIWLLRIEN